MNDIQIGCHSIGASSEPFIIAEMSGNHNQSLEHAYKLLDRICESGVQAVKFQTYTPDTITLNTSAPDFIIDDPTSLWKGESLYSLYEKAYTPWEWHNELFQYARARNLIPFSTPFDETAVDFLESLGVELYKISSFENNHIPLLKKVGATGKPVIISSGASSIEELDEALETLQQSGCSQIIVLKCTSTYPASPKNSNLLTIPAMAERFGCPIGLSDHTLGIGVPIAAVAQGAVVIEKHVTLSRAEGGVDSAFSLEPLELQQLVEETRRAHESLGTVQFFVQKEERKSIKFKRSIYVSNDIQPGEVLSTENIRVVRPGYGLHPRYYEQVLGAKAAVSLSPGTALSFEDIIIEP